MRRALIVLLSAAAVITAGCGHPDDGAKPERVTIGPGLSIAGPRGWHAYTGPITAVVSPPERLLLTSYPTRRGGNCSPDRAEHDLPADGALLYLFEYRPEAGSVWAHLRRADFPPRPRHFTLPRGTAGRYECWRIPSYLIRFRAANRPFQAHIAFGPRAGAARREQVLRALDSLRVAPLPSPPRDPYAGWRSLHNETGDTLRTPPRWMAAGAPSPRRHAPPRALYLTANRQLHGLLTDLRVRRLALPVAFPTSMLRAFPPDAVLLWIREETPGRASRAFPRLPTRAWPRSQDFSVVTTGTAARWPRLRWRRAGVAQHGTRFAIWILSGRRAPASDVRVAMKSAASFAFSVGSVRNRPCRRGCRTPRPIQTFLPGAAVRAKDLERAIRTNPGEPATAHCRPATKADRRAAVFGNTHYLFACTIARRDSAPALFDVQVLGTNACFVAERRRPGQVDYGCIR